MKFELDKGDSIDGSLLDYEIFEVNFALKEISKNPKMSKLLNQLAIEHKTNMYSMVSTCEKGEVKLLKQMLYSVRQEVRRPNSHHRDAAIIVD